MLKELYVKYKEIILYLVFGVLSTIVNFIVYFGCRFVLQLTYMPSIIVAWIFAVLFAFVTNKYLVFETKGKTRTEFFREFLLFYGCRILSLLMELGCMWFFLQVAHWPEFWAKVLVQALVIISNYIFSKLLIFKKDHSVEGESE